MELKDIMCKDLVVCSVSDDISFISSKMRDNDIGFIPIVEDNHVVGVITDRDIACRIFDNDDFFGSVTDYMSRDIVSIDIKSSILDVLKLMKTNRIKRVIVSDNGSFVGIISISDIIPIDEYKNQVFDTIRSIWEIGPNRHRYETEIDEFYL